MTRDEAIALATIINNSGRWHSTGIGQSASGNEFFVHVIDTKTKAHRLIRRANDWQQYHSSIIATEQED